MIKKIQKLIQNMSKIYNCLISKMKYQLNN